jgi:putative transposase
LLLPLTCQPLQRFDRPEGTKSSRPHHSGHRANSPSCSARSDRPRLAPPDRAVLAALLHRLPRPTLRQLHLIVSPRHGPALAPRPPPPPARQGVPPETDRPAALRSIRTLVLRLTRENPSWGYRRTHGELAALAIKVAASTVWGNPQNAGIDPVPGRQRQTWPAFLRSQAHAILAADVFETRTLTGAPPYVLAVIEHATRRVRILGATAHPTATWTTQLARNLMMDLHDASATGKYLICDRDSRYTAAFNAVLRSDSIAIVKTGIQVPRMNAIMERWVRTCRAELLNRTLIMDRSHRLHPLREYETCYNEHRPSGRSASRQPDARSRN